MCEIREKKGGGGLKIALNIQFHDLYKTKVAQSNLYQSFDNTFTFNIDKIWNCPDMVCNIYCRMDHIYNTGWLNVTLGFQ